jgi:hypothetical protein
LRKDALTAKAAKEAKEAQRNLSFTPLLVFSTNNLKLGKLDICSKPPTTGNKGRWIIG